MSLHVSFFAIKNLSFDRARACALARARGSCTLASASPALWIYQVKREQLPLSAPKFLFRSLHLQFRDIRAVLREMLLLLLAQMLLFFLLLLRLRSLEAHVGVAEWLDATAAWSLFPRLAATTATLESSARCLRYRFHPRHLVVKNCARHIHGLADATALAAAR